MYFMVIKHITKENLIIIINLSDTVIIHLTNVKN